MQSKRAWIVVPLVLTWSACGPKIPAHYYQTRPNPVSQAYCDGLEAGAWQDARYLDRYGCVMRYGRLADRDAALAFECDLRERLDREASFEPEADWGLPIASVDPVYPDEAKSKGVTGHVDLQFDTDEEGATTNIRIIDSVPAGTFDDSARAALSKWRYCERGKADVRVRLRFQLQ